ncbi:alpha/beta fold hydrolase [Mesorhizobium caraganae]|uniref:alpha/beta fold hydrolase n=1 Tax=Mesorhizobium caraganae TaxID=483206 RepID=UPI00193AA963|nr:alpha/beta fold hydrolase [Mesorhizobium caraganae]MBM2711503.1 alpha/beta fold hydrolase [Mesorhizobium caraganae]
MFVVSEDGTRIAYEVIGTGKPLVLLHGFTADHTIWREVGYVERLAGRQLILIDARGHGRSDKPHVPEAYDAGRCATDVAAVLNDIGAVNADICGHSLGGTIALAFAAHYPNRVRSLVVNGAHPFGQDLSLLRAAVSVGIEPWISYLRTESWPLTDGNVRQLRNNDLDALRVCVALDRSDRSAPFVGFDRPILAISGEADPLCPKVRDFAALAGADYLELVGCNHFQAFLAVDPICARMEGFLALP